jgi:FkbM family methyltransferase
MLIPFDQLFKKYDIHTGGVLHLGANKGQEAEHYAAVGVKKVIWVEALPLIFEDLKKHLIRYPHQVALHACVSDVDEKDVMFNIANNEGQSSSFLQFGTHTKEHPTVKYIGQIKMKTKRVDTLLCEAGITLDGDNWFLNADLQGAELLAMKGMGDLFQHFRYAYIEVNTRELYKGCPFVAEIDGFLGKMGFAAMESRMTGSGWGDRFYQKV